ncbi:P-type conjugative transfer protein TrbL [Tepidicella xavieri]|uniref:Type IV secretion system protein TrbL n=1 Tax=Tepidicella xavieri TaxID=360241 RepID=A0A4R6TVF2_9BURK|nr:P-type conjugative transfer protein TrbL [Tepidicella xavieri]TDQ37770.1 type IV secretion system protein TrbL [Tepidicella xavieri]
MKASRSHALWLSALAVGLYLVAGSASAQAVPNTAILDGIADSYEAAATGWMGPMLAYANRLFALLLTIELAVTGTKYVLEKDDTRSLIAALANKILGVGFFYALLQFAPTWIPALINSFRDAGATVGGATALSPSAVFARGLNFVIIIFKSISDMDMWDAIGVVLAALPAAVFIIIAFVVVAGQLLVTLIESYFVISAAVIFLGFGGSRWTQDFVQKYLGYAISVGVKLMTLYLLIGASNTLFTGWAGLLSSSTAGLQFIINAWVVMGGAAFFAFLAWMIPSLASSMLSGAPSLTGGAAAGVIGGMVAGGIGAAATAGKGLGKLGEAAGAAFKGMGGGGSPGLAGSLAAGGLSTLAGAAGAASGSPGGSGQVAPPSSSGGSPAAPQAAGNGGAGPAAGSASARSSAAGGQASMPSGGSATPAAPPPAAPGSGSAQASQGGSASSSGAKASSSNPEASAAVSAAASRPVVDDFGSVVPPSESAGSSSASAAASPPATEANGIGAEGSNVSPPGEAEKGPGLLDRLRNVKPPQLQSDAAPGATVQIRFDSGRD